MAERKKIELQLNRKTLLELLYDEPIVGVSQFGEYYLYAVRNGGEEELSFFAPEEVHKKIKQLKRGDRFEITKTAEQKGKKIVTGYDVVIPEENKQNQKLNEKKSGDDSYYQIMLSCYEDGMKIQEKMNGMVDVNRIAITLFIARSKIKEIS